MRTLKVILFLDFLGTALFGLLALLFPALMARAGLVGPDAAYTRVAATAVIGFALALWCAFRDPVKNSAIILAVIVWLSLEALLLLIGGIAGKIPWSGALPGVILDGAIAIALVVFYPRRKKAGS